MPKVLSVSRVRATLFANPGNTAAVVWLMSTVGYLIPSFIKLLPLGEHYRNEKAGQNAAQDDYNARANELKRAKEKELEAETRVVNLGCAEKEYLKYNEGIKAFQKMVVESNLSTIDQLNKFWKMQIVADKMTTEESVAKLDWDETVNVYGYHYGCPGSWTCGKDNTCCFYSGFYTTTVTHDYDQKTTVNNYFKNIVQGEAFNLDPENCGYYSRRFNISSPITVKTDESTSYYGRKEDGKTFIDIKRDWGSKVTGFCIVDDRVLDLDISVLRAENQDVAASDILTRVIRFLASCVMAAEAVGPDYPTLRDSINQTIPGLINKVVEANATLQEKGLILAKEQMKTGRAEGEYDQGLATWLPQLFLVPGAIAILVYLALCYFRNSYAETQDASTGPQATDIRDQAEEVSLVQTPQARRW